MKILSIFILVFHFSLSFSLSSWAQGPSKDPKAPEGPKSSMMSIVEKLVKDLEQERKLSAKNLAAALAEELKEKENNTLDYTGESKIKIDEKSKLNPKDAAKLDDSLKSLLSKIEKLEEKKSLSADELLAGVKNIFYPVNQCLKVKAECASGKCCDGLKCAKIYATTEELEKDPKKKLILKCLVPKKFGEICYPFETTCEKGHCYPYYTNSTNLPICSTFNQSCKKDSDCCSTICDNNKCNTAYRCQTCVEAGGKVKAGEKCCEGLYDNLDGRCVTDSPPASASLFSPGKKKSFFFKLIDLIFPSAEAQTLPEPDENSNFQTCTFNSKRNYFKQLKAVITANGGPADTIDAIRAYEFMSQGNGVNDFWKDGSGKSIFTRAKAAGALIKQNRLATELEFKNMDEFMLCTCVEVKGINDPSVTPEQKTFYNGNCFAASQTMAQIFSQYNITGPNAPAIVTTPNGTPGATVLDDQGVGASGIKYKEMLVRYFARRVEIQSRLFSANVAPFQGLIDIRDFLYGVDWDGYRRGTAQRPAGTHREHWPPIGGFISDLIQQLVEGVTAVVDAVISQIAANTPLSHMWYAVSGLWRNGWPEPRCEETGSYVNWHCPVWVNGSCTGWVNNWTDHYFSCFEEVYLPNDVCGMEMPNSFCMKAALRRSDHGHYGQNKYLIDPLVPDTFSLPLTTNVIAGMNWNSGIFPMNPQPTFDDTKYAALKALASLYAKDQDFYATQAEQDAFGEYVVNEHFITPYLSNSGAIKHPTPGRIPYYEGLVQKMSYISDAVDDIITPPMTDPNNPPCGDLCLLGQYANDYVKTVEGLKGPNKVLPGNVLFNKINEMKGIAQLASIAIHGANANQPVLGSNFDRYKNTNLGSSLVGMGNSSGSYAIHKAKQKKKYNDWMSKVGKTDKGKAMSNSRKSLDGVMTVPQVAGSDQGGAHKDDKGSNTENSSAVAAIAKKAAVSGSSGDENYGESGYGGRSSPHSSSSAPTDANAIKEALEETKSKNYQPLNADSLWQIVSKAYARGAFPNLLYGQPGIPLNKSPDKKPELVIDDEKEFAPTKSKKRKAPDTKAGGQPI